VDDLHGPQCADAFCLNGVVYHHVNGSLAAWTRESLGLSAATVAAWGRRLRRSAWPWRFRVLLCKRALPQLIGRPREKGPLLPNLL